MELSTQFCVLDWCLWQDNASNLEPTFSLPMMLRRRLGKQPLKAAQAAASISGIENATYVVSSRHGDFRQTLKLLRALFAEEGLSPTSFSLAVHNMLAGILSIATKNEKGHTALAAGSDTFVFAVMECLARLRESPEIPVLLIFLDEPLIDEFSAMEEPIESSMALVLLLASPESTNNGELYSAQVLSGTGECIGSVAQAESFISFMVGDSMNGQTLGQRIGWRWQRHV